MLPVGHGPLNTDQNVYSIYTITHKRVKPLQVIVKLNDIPVKMEIDTGASLTLINQSIFVDLQRENKNVVLQETPVKFRTYSGDTMVPLGVVDVDVEYLNQVMKQPVFVVPGNSPWLIGRDWLSVMKLNWSDIFFSTTSHSSEILNNLLQQYGDVFKNELGTLKGYKALIYVKDDVTPKYFKARPVPYALKTAIEK